jgi:hypothetical protein
VFQLVIQDGVQIYDPHKFDFITVLTLPKICFFFFWGGGRKATYFNFNDVRTSSMIATSVFRGLSNLGYPLKSEAFEVGCAQEIGRVFRDPALGCGWL